MLTGLFEVAERDDESRNLALRKMAERRSRFDRTRQSRPHRLLEQTETCVTGRSLSNLSTQARQAASPVIKAFRRVSVVSTSVFPHCLL